jgi:hypothetical protein
MPLDREDEEQTDVPPRLLRSVHALAGCPFFCSFGFDFRMPVIFLFFFVAACYLKTTRNTVEFEAQFH